MIATDALSPEPEGVDLAVRLLAALRPLAERSGNSTLLALTDCVCQSRDANELVAVITLYRQEYPGDPLAGKIHVWNTEE
jgi:hypothetical protein